MGEPAAGSPKRDGEGWSEKKPVVQNTLPTDALGRVGQFKDAAGEAAAPQLDSGKVPVSLGTTVATVDVVKVAGTAPTVAGKLDTKSADGDHASTGATTDLETASTVIGRLKRLVTLLSGGLPAALTAGGGLKIGVVDSLPAGTNAIGKLSANSGVDIGDVDVTSVAGNVATTIADGAAVTLGATTDVAVTTDANGTISAKLRGLVKMLADVWIDAANALRVQLTSSAGTEIGTAGAPVRTDPTGTTVQPVDTELPAAAALADAAANPTVPAVGAHLEQYNGSTWDRERNNVEGTLLASAARTATAVSADQTNYNARGVMVFLAITAAPATAETLSPYVQAKDPVSGNYEELNNDLVITGSTAALSPSIYFLQVYPGVSTNRGRGAVGPVALPRTWRVRAQHSGASAWTYSVGYSYIN